ncbi:hypothetical protein SARC_10452 [Sphaeroforma arctica JP610]|uniref:Uncharacterized protein n=1 Tax=Sphaeroforma arctica JP610 TaxID=667725 RepID=A0A0L0FJY8_9EUKA|nr:hypothetical protein SARC_10452 [Sphaeroforma arctica JP610]KNC77079.1 hypothetical protein SARC_10452 [Sphaeroforma arctica JP610]|eukprot:XP_014150981.1 hypothetical protein SARC_10452 [Sphaeroforma arctica JP610]
MNREIEMQDNLQANNQAWSPGLDRSGTAEHAQQRARRTQSNVIHKTPPPTGLTITAADGVVTDALQYRRGSVQRRNMKGVASLPAGPIRKSESDGSLNGQDGTRSSHDSTKSPKGTRPAKRFSVLNSPQIRRVENLFGLVRKSSSKGDLAGSNSDNDEDSATRLEQKGGTSSKASQLSEKPNKLSKKGSKPATLNQVTTKGIENAAFVMANIWNPLRSGFQFLKPTFPQIVSELEEHASYSNIFHSGVMCVKINTVMWRLSVGMLTARNLIVFTLVRTQDMLGEIIVSISPINIIRCEAIESKRDHPDHLFNCYLRHTRPFHKPSLQDQDIKQVYETSTKTPMNHHQDGRTLKCATTADWRRDKWVTEINAVLKRNEGVVKVTKDHLKLEKWSRAMSSVSASSNEMSEGDAQEGTFKDGVAVLMVALARSQAAPGENCGSVLLGIRPEVGAKIVFCRPQSAMEEVRIFLTSGNYASINLNRSLTSIKHYIRIGGIPDDKPSHIPNYELVEILKPDDLSPVVNPILEESNARQLTPNARLKKYLHAVCVYIHTYELLCVGLSLLLVGIVLPSIVADYIVVVVGTAVVCLFLHLHVMPDLDTVKDHETYYELTINGTLRFSDCSDDDESDTATQMCARTGTVVPREPIPYSVSHA